MHQNNHKFKTIAEYPNGYIGFCHCCNSVNICYKNSLFSFGLDDYKWFYKIVTEKQCLYHFHTSHGKQMMLKTPMQNYCLLFETSELDELALMIKESMLVIDSIKNLQNQN